MKENNDICLGFDERELKAGPTSFMFSPSVSTIDDKGERQIVDTKASADGAIFAQNYKYWNQATEFSSTNNTNNSYFKAIVDMGVDAVPYILQEIKKKPSQLVYALDSIFPGVMKYNGYVTLKDACDKWIEVLQH